MTTGTRSLPTDSPVLYFQPIERGHMSEGMPSDIDSLRAVPHEGMQMPPTTQTLVKFLTYLQVVLNTIL